MLLYRVQCKAMYPSHHFKRQCTHHIIIKNRVPDSVMVGKDKPSFHGLHHVNAITFLLIGIIITSSISFAFTLVLNQNHTAMAQQQQMQQQPQQPQQQMQANQTFSPSAEEQQQLLEGISFQLDDVTFTHRMATVNNGTQIHYVIGRQGDPVVLLHGWPETWYAWRNIMPALAQN